VSNLDIPTDGSADLYYRRHRRDYIINTVDMLIMHMVMMHISHNASNFQDPAMVPN
jgi:hypothetical protein